MLRTGIHGPNRAHSPGLLWRFYRWLRGTEQILVRPATELPLVLISFARGDQEGALLLQQTLGETWVTLPAFFRQRYSAILGAAPPLIIVILRRRNICSC